MGRQSAALGGALESEVHEALVGGAFGFTGGGAALDPGAVGVEVPGLAVVREHDVEDFAEAGLEGGIEDGGGGFDAVGEVAGHPIGRAHVVFLLAIVVEVEDAGVFKEAADDGDDADVFREAFDAGAETAEAADEEVGGDAGGAGAVEGIDDFAIFELVHFGGDAGGAAGGGVIDFALDHVDEAAAHFEGCDEELAIVAFEGATGEEGEEVDDVIAEIFAAGEEADVGIELGSFGVVVSGGDVGVAAEAVVFAADDEGGFGVGFQAEDAVDDVGAGGFEGLGPLDVAFFIEAGFEFDEDGDLLAGFGGAGECGDEGGIATGAVEGHFEGDDLGVFGGGEDEAFDGGVEAFIGVVHEDVILADDGEEVGIGIGKGGGDLGSPDGGFEVGTIDAVGEGHEIAFAEWFGEFVEGFFGGFESIEEELAHLGGHGAGDLDADGFAEAALAEFFLDGFEKIFGIFIEFGFDFGVAGDAEVLVLEDFHAGEE